MLFATTRTIAALFQGTVILPATLYLSLLFAAMPAQAGIFINVDPGAYTGEWSQAAGGGPAGFAPGARTIEVNEGFNFMFVGGIGGFQFNVAADGTVTTGTTFGTGGPGTLTFKTITVDVDPGDFTGQWIISRVTGGIFGSAAVVVVPGMPYLTFVGGGNFARFHFTPAADGLVTITANPGAAEGGDHSVDFNTTEVYVDPGSYAGGWQIPGIDPLVPIIQSSGPDSAILVIGVSYALIPDRAGLNFPVTDPCGSTELDFVDFIFTIGCAPVSFDCAGFSPPMNKVVTVHNHRALPLKASLIDDQGFSVSDIDIMAFPVVEVLFTANVDELPVDVTADALPVGSSSSGNTFQYDLNSDVWRFNLSTENYSAVGTYRISLKTGDAGEYAVTPTCEATFVIQ